MKGEPVVLLLDVVEVAKSHSGVNLAAAFAHVLEEFGLYDKVSGRVLKFQDEYSLVV